MKDIIKYIVPYLGFLTITIVLGELGIKVGQVGFVLLTGIISIYYYLLDNPYKKYQKPTIILFVLFLISLVLSRNYNLGDSWLPATMAGALSIVYFNRFRNRPDKHWVDYAKVVGAFMVVPAMYLDLAVISIPFLVSVFFLDRLLIRRHMNKNTQIITFCLISLVCITFLAFALKKANDAEKAAFEAKKLQIQVVQLQEEANEMRTMAEEAAAHARMAQADAEEAMARAEAALRDCQSK